MILDELTIPLIQKRAEMPMERAMLVGISGIDGSGKEASTEILIEND